MVMAVATKGSEQLQGLLRRTVGEIYSADLEVVVSGDRIVICGRVGTWHEKQRVQEILRRLYPAMQIHNGIEVVRRAQLGVPEICDAQ